MKIDKVAIFCAPKERVLQSVNAVEREILNFGLKIVGFHGCGNRKNSDPKKMCEVADLVIVLGGDGTILYASRFCGDKPILGVNFGKIGFLSDISPDHVHEALELITEDKFWVQELRRLSAEIEYPDSEARKLPSVLNEYLLFTSALAKMISIEIFIDYEPITKVRGDGLIVATPIGSSAYALSAGGPILLPETSAYLVVPLSPLWGKFKPMVLSKENTFSVKIREDGSSAVIVGDGMEKKELPKKCTVHFSLSDEKTRFIRFGSRYAKLSRLMLII